MSSQREGDNLVYFVGGVFAELALENRRLVCFRTVPMTVFEACKVFFMFLEARPCWMLEEGVLALERLEVR